MRQDLKLGTFFGIEVGLNWSVALILALFAWELSAYVLPARAGHPDAADWVAGVIGGLALLASVLVHEISHALVSLRNGVRVRSITLFLFGGIAQLEGEAHTPGADFRIAAVGPATSALLAGLFGTAQAAVIACGGHGLPVAVLSWLWQINLLLAVFNLIPGAPLDGGRVLRAILWRRTGDRLRATVSAAHAGRVVGVALMVLGALSFFGTGDVIGLWPALIGYFVYMAAGSEERFARAEDALSGVSVRMAMTPAPPAVPSTRSVAHLAGLMWQTRGDVVVVTTETGAVVGIATARAVRSVPERLRPERTVGDIALRIDDVPVARPDESMSEVLERVASSGVNLAAVFDEQGHLVGVVAPSDFERAMAYSVDRRGRTGTRN